MREVEGGREKGRERRREGETGRDRGVERERNEPWRAEWQEKRLTVFPVNNLPNPKK